MRYKGRQLEELGKLQNPAKNHLTWGLRIQGSLLPSLTILGPGKNVITGPEMYMAPANGSGYPATYIHTYSFSLSLSHLPPPPHTLHFSLSSATDPDGWSLRGLWHLVSHTIISSILGHLPGSHEPKLWLSHWVACGSAPVLCAAGAPPIKEGFAVG